MDQDIYDKARELIKTRKFDEARRVLRPIAHETKAKSWLDKIDEVSPPKAVAIIEPQPRTIAKPQPVVTQKKSRLGLGILLGLLLGAIGGIALGFFLFSEEEAPANEKIAIVTATPEPATSTPVPSDTPTNTLAPTQEPSPTEKPCSVNDWWEKAEPLMLEFLDTAEVAASTSRASLSPLILELQRIERDFKDTDTELVECAEDIYVRMWAAMELTVDGFTGFLADDEIAADVNFTLANQYFGDVAYMLIEEGVFTVDNRLVITFSIWGGDVPEGTTTSTPTIAPTLTPSTTPTPINMSDANCAGEITAWFTGASPLITGFLDTAREAFDFGNEGIKLALPKLDDFYTEAQGLSYEGCAALPQSYLVEAISQTNAGFHDYLNLGRGVAKLSFSRANEQFYLLYALLIDSRINVPNIDRRVEETWRIWGGEAAPTLTPEP